MRFHYLKDKKPICGKKLDPRDFRYITNDWSMVDCQDCLGHKDVPISSKLGKKSKYDY